MTKAPNWVLAAAAATLTLAGGAASAAEMQGDGQAWLEGKLDYEKFTVTYTGEPIKLRYASYVAATAPLEKAMITGLKRLETITKGKIVFETYPGESLHPQRQGFTAARDGIADYTACFSIYEPKSFVLTQMLTLPFKFENSVIGTAVFNELYPKYFKKEFDQQGVYAGRLTVTPPYNIIGSKPLRTIADFKGVKVRLSAGIQAQIMQALGGIAVNVPSAEAYTSLQRGVVDGVAMNDPALQTFKLHEISKYHSAVSLFAVDLEYCLGPKWYDALPADLKKVVADFMQGYAAYMAQGFYEPEGETALNAFKAKGVELIRPTKEEFAVWQKAVADIDGEYVASLEKDGKPGKAVLADMTAAIAKYEKMDWKAIMRQAVTQPVQGIVGK